MKKTILATCVAILALVVALPAHQAVRRFTFDDFSKVKRVGDPQFSPDGKSIAIIVSEPNLDEDRYMASVDVVDIASEQDDDDGGWREGHQRVVRALGAQRPADRVPRQRADQRVAEAAGVRRVRPRAARRSS